MPSSAKAAETAEAMVALAPDSAAVLGALAFPVLVVNGENRVGYLNAAAEQFFDYSASSLLGQPLSRVIPPDSPVFSLIDQVRSGGASISEHGVDLVLPRGGGRNLSVHGAPLGEDGGWLALSLQENATARAIERQLFHRGAARSVSAMASLLAHEVKNPLSGIRGAAQLLEQTVSGADRKLTRLICEESDRICALVDRMDVFADGGPPARSAVNIHEVLERVQRSATAGFARNVKIVTDYDPSLPPVFGNFDQLVQVFMNLVKNAAEAVPAGEGEICLGTGFRRGVRLALPGGEGRIHLPLLVTVGDNGPGIPSDLAAVLFDPFVTTKNGGTGLGLALVAKIVNDHGGVIEFDTGAQGTTFRVLLPMIDGSARMDRSRDA
jgi:two-component system nitrogen regulation sensor histidine kinase GlnL